MTFCGLTEAPPTGLISNGHSPAGYRSNEKEIYRHEVLFLQTADRRRCYSPRADYPHWVPASATLCRIRSCSGAGYFRTRASDSCSCFDI